MLQATLSGMKTKRIAVAVLLALVVVGYGLLLWKGPWWIDGAHLRAKNLQPADGVVITGFRTMLVAMGAGAVAGRIPGVVATRGELIKPRAA